MSNHNWDHTNHLTMMRARERYQKWLNVKFDYSFNLAFKYVALVKSLPENIQDALLIAIKEWKSTVSQLALSDHAYRVPIMTSLMINSNVSKLSKPRR